MSLVLWLLLGGCRHPAPPEAPALVVDPTVVRPGPTPAGRVVEGVWEDARWPLRLVVPAGWTARPGADADRLRLTLEGPDGVRLEVLALDPGAGPGPRPECAWDFVDRGRYRVLHVARPITVATCTPIDADGPLRQGWYLDEEGLTWGFEAVLPAGRRLDGRHAVETLLGTVQVRSGGASAAP